MTALAANEARLLEMLDRQGIIWEVIEHAAVFTVEESAELHGRIAGAHTKNLFLKDAGGRFWLVSAPHDARVDLKLLPAVIGAKKLSFGKADDMERLLGVAPGSVTPLAAMNDAAAMVTVVIDRRLARADRVNVHPLRNTATLGLSGAALCGFLGQCGHPAMIVDVPAGVVS